MTSKPDWIQRLFVLLTLVVVCVFLVPACAGKTAVVRTGPHRPSEEPPPVRVGRPPPPAEVETLPLRRNPDCYYQDGYYEPDGSTWKWVKGSWILPPRGCYFAPPSTAYEDLDIGTTLVFRPGVWHSYQGLFKCAAPAECPPQNAPDESPPAQSDDKRDPK